MNNKAIVNIIEDRVKSLHSLSEKINAGFEQETIHEFRTTTKQFRSFLRLLHSYIPSNDLKIAKNVRRLYSAAGCIRDAQLELEELSKHELSLPAYFAHLRQTINDQQKDWHTCFKENAFSNWKGKLISVEFPDLQRRVVQEFINNKTIVVINLLKLHDPTDNQIHNARKAAKDIMYIMKIMKKEWPAGYVHLTHVQVPLLGKITDAIGEYHDGCVLLEHLNSFTSPKARSAEIKAIRSFTASHAEKLVRQKSVLFSLIHDLATQHALHRKISS